LSAAALHFTYTQPVAVTDVAYQVEWANTLGSAWTSSGITRQILADDGVTRAIRATLPRGGTGQRFVRLRVVQ
jgi:hypothetical protein